jgi:hypothetical protein
MVVAVVSMIPAIHLCVWYVYIWYQYGSSGATAGSALLAQAQQAVQMLLQVLAVSKVKVGKVPLPASFFPVEGPCSIKAALTFTFQDHDTAEAVPMCTQHTAANEVTVTYEGDHRGTWVLFAPA